ncbi:MAG TPA: Fic family protein [Terrimicrobiaceae bacterium]|nr:Fic family protein [Terrimicrobiaceae bacterium]
MASPSEKLAQSLDLLSRLQREDGAAAIRSADMPRADRERLMAAGFLQDVMKGWYIPARPDDVRGESTAWYTSFWRFCAAYLQERFDTGWCLSPEQSLSMHGGNWSVPKQLLVRSPKAGNKVTNLPHNTSLLDVRAQVPSDNEIAVVEGVRVFGLEAALIACAPGYFAQSPTDVRAALAMVKEASGLLARLLEGGHSTIAGRLAGAFRNIGRDRIADDIVRTMTAAGYSIRENDPFAENSPLALSQRELSPYVNRIRLLWQAMRQPLIENFPASPGLPHDIKSYMHGVDDVYITDAYHSLSIEGYRVKPDLIDKVRWGTWNPDNIEEDRNQRNALAARGYWDAFQTVRASVKKVLTGANPGQTADEDHGEWYRQLFVPSVTAGLLRPGDLAGYRNGPVYIRRSHHVPMNHQAVRDAMPAFFELLAEETNPAVRVVLGHFIFVYIHPYMDGNGRIGRFLMNLMLAAGGYPWTVIPVDSRNEYIKALEQASMDQNIVPFARFLGDHVQKRLSGQAPPEIPRS